MKTVLIKFEFLSWWHAGSGMGQGGAADALVMRDRDGLPYLPGKTVKGLLRDAVQLAEDFGHFGAVGKTDELFGPKDPRSNQLAQKEPEVLEAPGRRAGTIRKFENAVLPQEIVKWLDAGGEERKAALFDSIASTALDEQGVAANKSLRVTEVCPPLILTGKIIVPDDGIELLKRCAPLIRSLGKSRHRGLGRCHVSVEDITGSAAQSIHSPASDMAVASTDCLWLELWLEITLTSDVVFSASAATTGGHESLDYVPGSALLGAAVKAGFDLQHRFDPELFLSGKIRFGDGLPLSPEEKLGWPMPLNAGCEKKAGAVGTLINGLADTEKEADARAEAGNQAQQVRGGYLALPANTGNKTIRFKIEGEYFLKTARDREGFGRAKEAQLFEFDTVPAGSRFLAAIRWAANDANTSKKINELVQQMTAIGIQLGRSRTAQFGSAQVKLCNQLPIFPQSEPAGMAAAEQGAPPHPIHFYLASDVALASGSTARLSPQPQDFGLGDDWKLVPNQTFLRTRRYSPWVSFHQSRTTERQVISRGSVITFARKVGDESSPWDDQPASADTLVKVDAKLAKGVGEYRQDGLGWVLRNPDFVLNLPELIKEPVKPKPVSATPRTSLDQPLLKQVVKQRQDRNRVSSAALEQGLAWAVVWADLTGTVAKDSRMGKTGNSQWGKVRGIALNACGDLAKLEKELSDFCPKGLRKKFWTHQSRGKSLWVSLSNACSQTQLPSSVETDLRGHFICLAIAVAAGETVRKLQDLGSKERGLDNKGVRS